MREILIKVCGMKDPANIAEVVLLKPQFIGFILYEGSPRFVNLLTAERLVKNIPSSIQKTAVLVNEQEEKALLIARSGIFDIIQLHGNESADFCTKLSEYIPVIKAFSIRGSLPENLQDYQHACSMFLFDTAGEKFGGTGKKFNHSILNNYSLKTDYMISGGISAEDSGYIKNIQTDKMAGVDLNSRFETKPGIKDISQLKYFIEKIRTNDKND